MFIYRQGSYKFKEGVTPVLSTKVIPLLVEEEIIRKVTQKTSEGDRMDTS